MANKKNGWIPIYRSIQDHWLWISDQPFDDRSAWIDLLLSANHEDKKLKVGKQVYTIHAGQMWTSYVKLARKWHWNKKRVFRYLKMLISDGMVLVDGTPNGTLLTVVNYRDYAYRGNTKGYTEGYTEGSTEGDAEGSTVGSQTITTNNINNIKNETIMQAPPRGGGEWQ